MLRKILVLTVLFCSVSFINGQDVVGDSLRTGRVCKLVLYNSYQAEGKIISVRNDTLSFQTDITKLLIPVKDIKFVLAPDAEIPEAIFIDTVNYEIMEVLPVNMKMTGACDVF